MNGGAAVSGAVTVERRRRVAIGAAVTAVHVAVLIWLGVSVVPVLPEVTTRAFDVVLMRPATKPNPDSDSPISGGGAASAPSTVHLAPEPRLDAVELTAPTEPAPLQPLVLGVAPLISPSSSAGAGTKRRRHRGWSRAGCGREQGCGPDRGTRRRGHHPGRAVRRVGAGRSVPCHSALPDTSGSAACGLPRDRGASAPLRLSQSRPPAIARVPFSAAAAGWATGRWTLENRRHRVSGRPGGGTRHGAG